MSLLKTLKGQILVLSALCMVAALLVLTLVNYFSARGQAQVSLAEEGLATAKSHAETIEEWARGKSAIIAASVTAFEEPEPAKPLAMLRDAGKFSTAYFGYADKKYVFSETRNLPADYDPTARPWYTQAAQAGTSVVTPPYISASDQKLVVTFATPVGAGAALKGVAAGDVYMESVVANVASIRPTPQSFGFLVSADGKIIAHRDQALTLKPIAELSKDLAVDKLVAAAKREPAHVVGNGKDTVQTLIEETNKDPRRGYGHENVLTQIDVDRDTLDLLEKLNYTVDSVPKNGEIVYLKSTANLSTGGTSIDVTDMMHPENIFLCERISRVI